MAFSGMVLTTKGVTLLAKVQAGATLTFTKMKVGDGNLVAPATLEGLNDLISPKLIVNIGSVTVPSAGLCRVRGNLNNTGVVAGFFVREIGVFATDPDLGEILYSVANAGNECDYLPAEGGAVTIEQVLDVILSVGSAATVTAVIDGSLYATVDDLSGYLPLAGGAVTGVLSGVTAPQFDNTTKFATTAFVQRALGNLAGSVTAPPSPLTAAHCGKIIFPAAGTCTLPLLSSVADGAALYFVNTAGALITLQRQGADIITADGSNLTSIEINAGDDLMLVKKTGGDYWVATLGSARLKYAGAFGASLNANGYQKLPSGLMLQWFSTPTSSTASTYVTLPVAFSSGILASGAVYNDAAAYFITIGTASASQVYVDCWTLGGARIATSGTKCFVLGK